MERRKTRQRNLVFDALMELNHPTAQDLYEHIHSRPDNFGKKISLGTVYRNLQILEEDGSLISIEAPSFVTHYDARLDPHYHFRCKKCGVVLDMNMDYITELNDKAQKESGCVIESHSLAFKDAAKNAKTQQRIDCGSDRTTGPPISMPVIRLAAFFTDASIIPPGCRITTVPPLSALPIRSK